MKRSSPRPFVFVAVVSCLFVLPLAYSVDAPPPKAPPANANPNNLGKDAHGNPIRRAPRTGHISNYDENKVGQYTLPDPLILASGQRVENPDTWLRLRRPEILKLYETQFYGRVPKSAPKVTFTKDADEPLTLNGAAAIHRHGVVTFGDGERAVHVNVHYYLPPSAKSAVPILLHLTFATNTAGPVTAPATATGPARPSEAGPIAEMLAQGFGYALVRYTEIQPDNAETHASGVQALAYQAGQTQPAPDEWGTVATWAWGVSRVLDFLATDSAIDAKRVALIGHSRLGKTALWAGASDPRFALIFSSCAGEMGSSLARRDYGETLDDMTGNFGWQFAGNLQQYAGRWNDLPVDAHMLIALCAPRPVFITGGTEDQWADPKGEFLAEVAAGPVYRLLGKKDLGTTELPPLDSPLIEGDLGFHYHTGGHTITAADWKAFLTFASRQLKP